MAHKQATPWWLGHVCRLSLCLGITLSLHPAVVAEVPFFLQPVEPRPSAEPEPATKAAPHEMVPEPVQEAPLGFTGSSGIAPREGPSRNKHFIPVEDRWRTAFPDWDRYDKGFPPLDDYPFIKGNWWNPFDQNVLKGDYPILGQHTFMVLTASLRNVTEPRQVATATTPFESTANPLSEEFFGSPNQAANLTFLNLSLDVFHGDAAFKPVDWRIKVTGIFNINYLAVDEVASVNPDVLKGTTRGRTFFALEEWFVETKLADIGPDYDFVSLRVGSQPFNSDFRGFIFADTNRAVRLFGSRNANREQFNLIFFSQQEKDTNSELNTFRNRNQEVLIANYFIQDFIFPGYTAQFSVHYNHDDPAFFFNKNNVLVRPDPVGVAQPHGLDVGYVGWTGDGHINRFNISHAYYWAFGRDSLNPIANRGQDISAHMAAAELSYDRDWVRFRTSFFFSSGDHDVNNSHATGFDSIFDNPNFAGGDFSYWQRQAIRLLGVNLVNRESLIPDLRSSKTQGQSNFVNPGLILSNVGIDLELTPRLRMINNVNFLWFDSVNPLRVFVFQNNINNYIGADLSSGFEYRPLLSNNVIIKGGAAMLLPGRGLRDLFDDSRNSSDPLLAAFLDLTLLY